MTGTSPQGLIVATHTSDTQHFLCPSAPPPLPWYARGGLKTHNSQEGVISWHLAGILFHLFTLGCVCAQGTPLNHKSHRLQIARFNSLPNAAIFREFSASLGLRETLSQFFNHGVLESLSYPGV
jgi:hypothetical protein